MRGCLVGCVLLGLSVGCMRVAVPEASVAAPERVPSRMSARVVFVLGHPDDAPPLGALPEPWRSAPGEAIDILDPSGELLGRMQNRTFLEIERPAGEMRLYAVSTQWTPRCLVGPCPAGDAGIGVLDAELEAGRTYAVWIGLGTAVGPFDVDARTRCNGYVERPLDMSGREYSVDLVAVRSTGWYESTLSQHDPRSRRMAVAPQGLEHPYAEAVLRAGDARVGACWDPEVSSLRPEDGARAAP